MVPGEGLVGMAGLRFRDELEERMGQGESGLEEEDTGILYSNLLSYYII